MHNEDRQRVKVKVLRAPADALPDWVRQAWIGVTMPAETAAGRCDDEPAHLHQRPTTAHTVRLIDAVAALHEHGRHSAADWLWNATWMRSTGMRAFILDDTDAVVLSNEHAARRESAPPPDIGPLPF